MATRDSLTVVGAVMGPPFDRRTWSGASAHLFNALRRRDVLLGAVNADPPSWFRTAAKVASVAPSRQQWRERYEYSPLVRRRSERDGARALAQVAPDPDVLLQIGAYYDFTRRRGVRPRLRASFHDANLALYAPSGVFIEDPEASHVRAMMRHEQRVLDGLDLIMPMSQWLADSFVKDFGQDPAKVVVVGSGVNNLDLPGPVEGRDWSAPHLLFIGFDWKRKGLPLIREAFQQLRQQHPEATLTIVGPPADGIAEPGVRWIGSVDRSTAEGDARMDRLQREANVFVLMPSFDPMPNVVMEAMAYGLPVVAPRSGSMPELVDDGVTGRLVADREPATVAAELDALFRDTAAAEAMGRAGRERVHARFTWDHVADRMIGAMKERLA
jgi:glycosyltransferase involved in cell wall biosynthesis